MSRSPAEVALRPVEERDLAVLFAHQCDPVAYRMAAFTPRDAAAFTAHWGRILLDSSVVARTILVGGQTAGHVGSWWQDGRRLVAYWVGREHWGRGVATRALALLLEVVTERPLEARVAVTNPASRRVLEKCGFVVTGRVGAPLGEDGEDGEGGGAEPVEELVLTLAAPTG